MKQFIRLLILSGLLIPFTCATAQVKVFACEPEWAELTKILGGKHVKIYRATHAKQDPHRIQARPSLIARLRNADLAVCTG
ncbi:MAG: zinc ABC transporter substrate-binding protein, partial [Aestuariibacter sp.]|nr:zinc ABC transporter substrate-binding protein [Aestuariibacter sp.]